MGYTHDLLTAMGVLFPVLAIAAMIARLYCSRRYGKQFALDDGFIIPAFLLTVTAGVAMIVAAEMKFLGGHSLPKITPLNYERINKFQFAFWIGHVLTIGAIKLSILFFFRRIFKGHGMTTAFDIANWALIGLVIVWTVVFFFFEILACGPHPEAAWSTEYWLQSQCINTFQMQAGCAISNWIIDLAILIEPIIMIQTLPSLRTRYKVQATAVFMLSTLAVVAGCLRMIVWIQVQTGDRARPVYHILGVDYEVADLEAPITVIVFWTFIEIGVGFLVACLLPSAKLFDAIGQLSFVQKIKSLTSSLASSARSRYSASYSPSEKSNSRYSQEDSRVSYASTDDVKDGSLRHYDNQIQAIMDGEERPATHHKETV